MTKKDELLKELKEIESLKDDWDNYGADALNKRVIKNTEFLINNLELLPKNLIPTPWGTIQMVWKAKNTEAVVEVLEPQRDGRDFESYLSLYISVTNREQETNVISKEFKLEKYKIIDSLVEFFICN